MAVTSGFFNSINGDRKYNARQIGMYLGNLICSGVFPNPSTNLQVTAAGGMAVQVWPGRGMADCHWIDNDSMYTLILDDADLILDRIDVVVMRLDESDDVRDVYIAVKKGTPASSPEAPAMERTEKVEEYCLAQIYVPKIKDDGTQEIIQANITDTRADTEVCRWVTSLIEQVDTHTLFLQWQDAYQRYYDESTAEFESWLAGVKVQLGEDAVGTLMEQIDGLAQSLKNLEKAHGLISDKVSKMKSVVMEMDITASGWEGDEAPYANTFEIEGVKPDSIVEVGLSKDADTNQVKACMNGQIADGGQAEGSVTLRAFGRKPDIDIPVIVIVRGDV